jgi:hypothetical protein
MTVYPTYTTPKTMEQIKARADWKGLDPEFATRLSALMLYGNGKLGFGGGSRTTAGQTALFLSRYHEDPNGAIFWNGKRWTKNPGVASAAPPGRSYHEPTTPDGKALAADMVGDLSILDAAGPSFGLINFENVNNEPWHAQPMEIPHARAEYKAATMHPLQPWSTSGNTPVPDEEEPLQLLQVPNDPAIFLRDGLAVIWMGPGVDTALQAAGVAPAGSPTPIARTGLKGLELRGPLPNYGGPGPTVASDFAKWTP